MAFSLRCLEPVAPVQVKSHDRKTDREAYDISRRTLQRARAKLSRLGLIEHVTWMNTRHGGQEGWKLSGRMSTALRQLADKIDRWREDTQPERLLKDEQLVELLK